MTLLTACAAADSSTTSGGLCCTVTCPPRGFTVTPLHQAARCASFCLGKSLSSTRAERTGRTSCRPQHDAFMVDSLAHSSSAPRLSPYYARKYYSSSALARQAGLA